MDLQNCAPTNHVISNDVKMSDSPPEKAPESLRIEEGVKEGEKEGERVTNAVVNLDDVDIDLREVYLLMMQFLSVGPCQKTFSQFSSELTEHELLPRRYHAWYSRSGVPSGEENDDGVSLPLTYENLLLRYPHIAKDHLVRLLKQLLLNTARLPLGIGCGPNAADSSSLLGTDSFSLLSCNRNKEKPQIKLVCPYLRWPHMRIDQVHGLHLRSIGGGFPRHHRASSIQAACKAIGNPSFMTQKMEHMTRLRGHRNAVYCAIFDLSGQYVITGSDDRLVKIWSTETALALASCRGHEGDITDLAVSSNNTLVASAANDFVIRVWRLPDGIPVSVLRGHTGEVTAISFSPRPGSTYQLLSASDDGTCRIWDARNSHCKPRLYVPKPVHSETGTAPQKPQFLCCAFNATGTAFVTGSSDTFARVWNACKISTDDPEQLHHEIDLLKGHENDVNYVQFSDCAVLTRLGASDARKDDHVLKFKNSSRFHYDYLVTCSRDGSAIIWRRDARRSYVCCWENCYHLKVPPPPLPPQPPRGGPRRRILPTPRGVNMIIWSLDNRLVLAAIMDCRICVWKASNGNLVHSLTGHTDSTFVLDVHPFNPRIAMSAGYDGKTIIWDIWEGRPVRVFEIGRGKLVDGKFSSDGTSIVVSDDVGQIYLLSTGNGYSHKDAKYDQFFLGDYRPLIQDSDGNVVDQETQLAPYKRNLQDPLCDSSMIPYPEPFQSTYQRRRLAMLGKEWHPSSMKFAIGPDFSSAEDYPIVPLPDPEATIDIPEPFDVAAWEQIWEPASDYDTDSEYEIEEEICGVKEQEDPTTSSTSDTDSDAEHSEHQQKTNDGLRRSKRKNDREEADFTVYGRCTRKRKLDDCKGTTSRYNRGKKSGSGSKASKKKTLKGKISRPQRVASRNAFTASSSICETYLSDDDEETSQADSSDSEPFREHSNRQIDAPEAQTSLGTRKFVLKLPVHNRKKPLFSEGITNQSDSEINCEPSSSLGCTEEGENKLLNDEDMAAYDPGASIQNPCQSISKVIIRCKSLTEKVPNHQASSAPDGIGSPEKLRSDYDIPEEVSYGPSVEAAIAGMHDHSHNLKVSAQPAFTKTRIKLKSSKTQKQEKTPEVNLGKEPATSEDRVVPNAYETSVCGMDKNVRHSSYKHYGQATDFPDAESHFSRRSRSIEMEASTRYEGRGSYKLKLKGDTSVGASKTLLSHSRGQILEPCMGSTSRLTRSRLENINQYEHNLTDTNRCISDGKMSWLMLSEQEPSCRYIPQVGDEVAYLVQGHQEYVELNPVSEKGPWVSFKGKLHDVENCSVEELEYATAAGSGEACCKLKLKFIDPSSRLCGKSFKMTLPELQNFSDFLVEKTWYDIAVSKNWAPGDICSVWWRNDNGEGGKWWEGCVVSSSPKSTDFPDSPWERFSVKYEDDDPQLHSPWELHEPDRRWDPPHIDYEVRNSFLDAFSKAERRKQEYGIWKLEQVSKKPDFLNRFPVPLSPELIRSRLRNNYYRSVEAVKHDISVMMANAMNYFSSSKEDQRKMTRLSDHLNRTSAYLLSTRIDSY